jgi:hypothetical protein
MNIEQGMSNIEVFCNFEIRNSILDLPAHAHLILILSSSPLRGGLRGGLIKLFQDPLPPPPKRGSK